MDYLLSLIRPQLLFVSFFLLGLGSVLKYKTKINNSLIASCLVLTSFVLCSIWGFIDSSFTGMARLLDAVVYCGLIQGIFVASIPVCGWDTVYGLFKYGLFRKKLNKEAKKDG